MFRRNSNPSSAGGLSPQQAYKAIETALLEDPELRGLGTIDSTADTFGTQRALSFETPGQGAITIFLTDGTRGPIQFGFRCGDAADETRIRTVFKQLFGATETPEGFLDVKRPDRPERR